jgi:hypothetical protein
MASARSAPWSLAKITEMWLLTVSAEGWSGSRLTVASGPDPELPDRGVPGGQLVNWTAA